MCHTLDNQPVCMLLKILVGNNKGQVLWPLFNTFSYDTSMNTFENNVFKHLKLKSNSRERGCMRSLSHPDKGSRGTLQARGCK